jgi:hypothetical protein
LERKVEFELEVKKRLPELNDCSELQLKFKNKKKDCKNGIIEKGKTRVIPDQRAAQKRKDYKRKSRRCSRYASPLQSFLRGKHSP